MSHDLSGTLFLAIKRYHRETLFTCRNSNHIILDIELGLQSLQVSFDVNESQQVYQPDEVRYWMGQIRCGQIHRQYRHNVDQDTVPATNVVASSCAQTVNQVAVLVVITDVEIHDNLCDIN